MRSPFCKCGHQMSSEADICQKCGYDRVNYTTPHIDAQHCEPSCTMCRCTTCKHLLRWDASRDDGFIGECMIANSLMDKPKLAQTVGDWGYDAVLMVKDGFGCVSHEQ